MSLALMASTAQQLAALRDFRRRQAAAAKEADSFIRSPPFIRSLTPEEEVALKPWLVEVLRPHTPLMLRSKGVYRLEGVYHRIGEDSDDPQQLPAVDMVDSIEVRAPYDARDYLDGRVSADVVFAGHYAILLRFNDTFDIVEGMQRFERTEEQVKRWTAGEPGLIKAPIGFADVSKRLHRPLVEVTSAKVGRDTVQADGQVRIVSQRPETPSELKRRKGPGLGLRSGLCWLMVFFLLSWGQHLGHWGSGLIALLFAGLAIWLFWFKRKHHEPVGVNLVEGPLRLMPHANPIWASQHAAAFSDKLAFTIPNYWSPEVTRATEVRAEIRVSDYSCMSYNGRLFLDQERPYKGPLRWGRHLVLAMVAYLGLLWVMDQPHDTLADVLWTFHHFMGSSPTSFSASEDLLLARPGVGSFIAVEGEGRCQIGERRSLSGNYWLNCDAMSWGGDSLQAEFTSAVRHLDAMYSASLMDAQRPTFDNFPLGRWPQAMLDPELFVVINHADVVEAVRTVCFDGRADQRLSSTLPNAVLMACTSAEALLQRGFHFTLRGGEKKPGVMAVRLGDRNEPAPLMRRADIEDFNFQTAFIGRELLGNNIQGLAKQLYPMQTGGAVLLIDHPEPPRLNSAGTYEAPPELLAMLLAFARGEQPVGFKQEGVVTRQRDTESNTLELTLNIRDPEQPSSSQAIRALWFVLVLLLLLIHVPIAVWKIGRTLSRMLGQREG